MSGRRVLTGRSFRREGGMKGLTVLVLVELVVGVRAAT